MYKKKLLLFFLFFWPFIYLFPYTIEIIDVGNDFELLYYSYKKYIFEFILDGHIPYWSPSESNGYSLIFNPFAQYFYPLSWLLYFVSYLFGDLSKYGYVLYSISAISIYAIGQFLWLRSLKIENKYAFIATIITCAGLKLTEILRFPNALHAFAWFPFILYALTILLNQKNLFKGSIIIFVSCLMIFTAGYPYYIFYGFILFLLYFLFTFLLGFKFKYFYENNFILQSKKNYVIGSTIPPALAFVIVLPWFYKIYEIMKITRDRNLNSLEFSYLSSSNFLDQLGSWVFPPYAIAEGWYYFGSVITLLIIYFLFVTFFQKSNSKEKLFVYFFIIFFLISFQFAAAKSSLIFDFFWEKFEFLRNFRIWSRMNIILVPIISILVALSLKKIENFPEEKLEFKKHILIFFSLALLILVVQIYLIEFHNVNNYFWETWQMKRLDFVMEKIKIFSWLINLYNNYIYAIFLIVSVISVLSLIVLQKKNLIIYCVAMLVVSELFFISNIQWAIPKNHYNHKEYNYFSSKPMIELRNAFIKPSISTVVKGNTYFRNERNFNINYFDVFGIETHTRIFDSYLNRKGEFKENVSIKDRELVNKFYFLDGSGKRAFFSKSLNHENLMEFISDADQTEIENNVKINIEIDTYTGDEIHINVENEIGGYLTLIDNWAPGWIGKVNGEEVRLEKLFNTYKSVKLNSGKNKVYLKYNPW